MKQKEITIGGRQYPVAFTMKTIEVFERITQKSFLSTMENEGGLLTDRIALIRSAVLTVEENSPLKESDIRGGEDFGAYKDITAAYAVVMPLVAEFFAIPFGENQRPPKPSAKKSKN